ncbi:unnamed protein product [Darwinula stevensoni]|uniref:Uncharacterized protein n=1 Tax=Darwinula stevensoni TaxID=69355 RepID=A0A7R8X8L0_9CRUS|nr:unnamed protein product [Darwinula stevensoni]CAG0888057.1 unnamed protein product [Darwinula stevensoni]
MAPNPPKPPRYLKAKYLSQTSLMIRWAAAEQELLRSGSYRYHPHVKENERVTMAKLTEIDTWSHW